MPDDQFKGLERHRAAVFGGWGDDEPDTLAEALEWARGQVGQPYDSELPALQVRLEAGPLTAAPVAYEPWIEYRGRVLWHHLSDAHAWATLEARRTGRRYLLRSQRVPGWAHPLWWVRPKVQEMHFTRDGEHSADECGDPGCAGLRR